MAIELPECSMAPDLTISGSSLPQQLRHWASQYHYRKLSPLQRWVGAFSILALAHFALGIFLWGWMFYAQMYSLVRNSKPGLLWSDIWGWLPYFARCWKSVLPFDVALVAIYILPRRPQFAAVLVSGILVFSVVCAWYDIQRENYDFATFGPPWGGHMNHYFNWWWCHQRPK